MRKLLLFVLCLSLSCSNDEETFEGIHLNRLVGKSVEKVINRDVFKNFNSKNYSCMYYPNEDKHKLHGIFLSYNNDITVSIYLNELEYTNPFSKNRNWNFETIEKEIISCIEITQSFPSDIIIINTTCNN